MEVEKKIVLSVSGRLIRGGGRGAARQKVDTFDSFKPAVPFMGQRQTE